MDHTWKFLVSRIYIHTLELKLWGSKGFKGSHVSAMFAHKKFTGARYVDEPLLNIMYIAATCIVWLY